MEESGIPAFIAAIVSAALVIGMVVAMAVVTWIFVLAPH